MRLTPKSQGFPGTTDSGKAASFSPKNVNIFGDHRTAKQSVRLTAKSAVQGTSIFVEPLVNHYLLIVAKKSFILRFFAMKPFVDRL